MILTSPVPVPSPRHTDLGPSWPHAHCSPGTVQSRDFEKCLVNNQILMCNVETDPGGGKCTPTQHPQAATPPSLSVTASGHSGICLL